MAERKFHMTFDKCPNCGCEETITQLAWAEEAEKGRVKPETPVAAFNLALPLADPNKPPVIMVGMMMLKADFCAECGTMYCREVKLTEGQVSTKPPPRGPSGMPFSPS
jgi:hypothetical protein